MKTLPEPDQTRLCAETQSPVLIPEPTSDSGKALSPALQAARRKHEELKAAGIPRQRRMPAASVLMRAIRDECLRCECKEDPCVQWRIANCTVPGCHLRPFRPYQSLEGLPRPQALQYESWRPSP